MNKQARKLSFLLLLLCILVTTAFSQVTTSSMSGRIADAEGAVIGATVVATHTPSGTTYGTITNKEGRFNLNGMRVGGPYTVKVSFVGYGTYTQDNITLSLGQNYVVNAVLTENLFTLDEVVAMATRTKFSNEKTGTLTNITTSQIANMPTVSRSVMDITRLSPYGGNGMSFVGTDGRTANFTVDGANFNNNFGLSSALPGGGNPISIEAIEELQVVIAPYDVRQTNFIGGGVNAITKSGTNTFSGSVYTYHRNENMRGDAVKGLQIAGAREKDRNTTYGFTLSGPIIKNKLFLFANGEMAKTPTVVNRWRASTDGVANADNYISRTTKSDLQTVSDYVKSKYGYETGSYTNFPADENNYKFLARLDWNITNKHRLALRYNYTKNLYWSSPNASSMDGGTRMSEARMSQASMSYANSMYSMNNLVHSFSFDLNSRLSDNLSNQFLATYSKLDDLRGSTSDQFPFIDILKDGQAYLSLGYELFTWNNAVHNNVWNIKDELTLYLGNHKIVAGAAYEYKMADNAYMRNGTGYYRYRSLEDFLNAGTPEVVCLTYGYDGESNPAARIRTNKIGVYGQDDWSVTENFKLSYGLRLDGLFFNNDDLLTNKAIYDLDYSGRHIDTGEWPSANIIISPRIGFVWDTFGDKSLKIRGGTGLFSGNLPLVFFTNMPTNGGMVQYQAQIGPTAKNKDTTPFAGGLVTDADGKANISALYNKLISLGYPSTISPEDGTVPSAVNGVDPNFKMPQVWKTSLAVDYAFKTSFPLSVTVEGIFNKTINGVSISDWSIPNVGGFARFNGVDNRPIYPAGYRTNTKAFVLENTSLGYGWSGNITLNAQPVKWISLMAAYTHTVAKDLTGMPGSAAESAFTYVPTVEGPNYIRLHNSQYTTPDRLVASLTAHDKGGNHYSFIYEGWHGGANYSYMTVNDINSDGYNYDVIYVPTDEEVANNQFRFVSADDKTRFMDYVHANDYLKNQQGKYAEAYSVYSPWVHRVDFGYKHDFACNVGNNKQKLQLSFDIKNVMNLFNSSWGVGKYLNPGIGSEARILKYEGVDAEGFATFSTPSSINGNTKTFTPSYSLGQCWYMLIGIKYIFN
ncbi:MAG TPA: carboxypeptidase regulatory-like domain-containing protein [Prolixibacteraceae bacterium]|nr:carboxypeptidase regulatory-like domain-containing protein [Prolixibacteraceae bacterium]HOS00582.1 carboxypeptidase regulatory-like domain-containing protein [Prolixibacteraceae bacterium]HOS91446.1 carboxypeptidase regulatory-like domain-containing protein [Prolixibacteraceae bacterium]HPL45798.1 carboxypeptidase regulatory-like domain-containing protein [Prolixibacteraceae bacterium]HQE53227.1 carboxypeptidase regulatory-like domain-containing protein [Prolixibacteraceae bacterium]